MQQPKDFDLDYKSKLNQKKIDLDPYLYTTPAVQRELEHLKQQTTFSIAINSILLSCVYSPFQTISASLQLAVAPHKNLYNKASPMSEAFSKINQGVNPQAGQVIKMNTQLTLQQKRKLQLQIRSGQSQPYTAPVYSSYMDVIRSLNHQGWKSYFKGNGFRSLYTFYNSASLFYMNSLMTNTQIEAELGLQSLKYWVGRLLLNIAMNPLFMGENRYILQNSLPQFKTYRKPLNFFKLLIRNRENFNGWKYHFFNNFIELNFRLPVMLLLINKPQHIFPLGLGLYLSEMLIYPLTTAYRRLACQTTKQAGMIPDRYSSLWHAMKVIWFQEGFFKGLMKGWWMYQLVIATKLLVPYYLYIPLGQPTQDL